MLKMRSKGRVNAQAAQYQQSLPIPHISKMLQRQKQWQQTLLENVHRQQSMDVITYSIVHVRIMSTKKRFSM